MPGSLARDARPTCALDVSSDAQWVGRLVRCRWRPAPPCSRASYDDPPQSGGTNSPQRERIDSRVVDAIAPRQDAGAPRARRATHLWVGRPVRCPVGWTSRPMQGGVSRRPAPGRVTMILPRAETRTPHSARGPIRVSLTPSLPGTMPGSLARDARPTCGLDVSSDAERRPAPPCSRASYDDPPQGGDTNSPQRERTDSRVVDAIAPRHDAGEPRAGRATHLWVGRLVRCRAASRAALLPAKSR